MRASDFVESYVDAWNHGDPQSVADHFTNDGVYFDIPEDRQRSHDELIGYLTEFFAEFKHRYQVIGDILSNRNAVAFQYHVYPHGKMSANFFSGAEFVDLRGDAAKRVTDYYDIPGVGRPASVTPISAGRSNSQKYAKSGLCEKQLAEYKCQLRSIMQSEQTYLRPDLTLPKLAQLVGCSVNHLSQVINSGFGMSFFDYLNRHRIEHAKNLLAALDEEERAVLNIAFTVGFNSNSAFYAAFKKLVGQTPAQYRDLKLRGRH